MKNVPAFRPGILPGRRVNGYKANSSRYFAGIFRPCKRGQSVLPLNWGGTETNRSVTCMVLKATANDRRHIAHSHDEFRDP
ncbi:hypothetical protein TNCV_1237381 [Trichonephila clavipes]|nr:hypothetical protein TNCV_1237381 [Trichonephila clavipes]